jgi:hypothetical protein
VKEKNITTNTHQAGDRAPVIKIIKKSFINFTGLDAYRNQRPKIINGK